MSGALAGHIFTFHGLSAQRKKELTEIIKNHGGEVLYIGKGITHLLTTPEEIKADAYRIIAAKQTMTVVTEDYIKDKTKNAKPVPKPIEVPKPEPKVETPRLPIVPNPPPVTSNTELMTTVKTVSFAMPQATSAPSITLLLPNFGPNHGVYKVAVYGINFIPSVNFQLKFGNLVCTEVEFHCSTNLIATIDCNQGEALSGEVPVCASNDRGRHFGPSVPFKFFESDGQFTPTNSVDQNVSILQGQLNNLRRHIVQLQMGVINAQKLETEIRTKVDGIDLAPISSEFQLDDDVEEVSPITGEPVHDKATPGKQTKEKQVIALKRDVADREIRMFISSPFKDMQEERENIIKKIIPKMRKICIERDIAFSYVDLRWGITGIQNESAATLLMCLREIERSNLFIGCYGERYGWCLGQNAYKNPTNQDELLKRSFELAKKDFPWIMDYKDRSVTEVEMRMILNHHYTGEEKPAWFYLRDPYYVESISQDKQSTFKSEGEYEHEKLETLKNDINESAFPSKMFSGPPQLEEKMLEDMLSFLDLNYPKGSELSPLESERFRHQAFAKSVTRVYLPNENYFMFLDKYSSSASTSPLLVLGPSGVGKSALLANWARRTKEHHPEFLMISHYIGCSPNSTNHVKLLTRVMAELQDQLSDFQTPIPEDPERIMEIFPTWVEKILSRNKRLRLILIIDGLDNLDDRENSYDLVWLPQLFPSSVRCVISLSPGLLSERLNRRKWEQLDIKSLNEAERISFIRDYLNLASKKLSEEQEFLISGTEHSGNPRYLKTLLEDISLWGQFEELTSKIKKDLKAVSASELYEIVLGRLEADYDNKEKQIIKNFMSYLWASRRGLLLETELSVILEDAGIDHHEWSPVYVILEDLLLSAGGLLTFANRDIKKAVENRYLANIEERQSYHSHLATLFEKIEGITERKVEELPYHLEQAAEFDRLKSCISDMSMFDKLYTSGQKFDLFRYWRSITAKTTFDPVKAYTDALGYTDRFPSGEVVADLFYRVGYFLEEIARYDGSAAVYAKARNYYEVGTQNLDVAKMDYSIGRVLLFQAKYREAEERLKAALKVYGREKGEDCIEVSAVILRLGSLYAELGKEKDAEEAFLKCLRIREEKLGVVSSRVAQTLKHMLTFYESQEKYDKAAEYGEKALKITEQAYGYDDLNVSSILVRLGRVYSSQKKYSLAKRTLKRALTIVENKVGRDHPFAADVIYELGCIYFVKPENVLGGKEKEKVKKPVKGEKKWTTEKAEEYFLLALKIKEATVGNFHPDVARVVTRLGSLYIERTEFERAELLLKRALKIREDKLGKDHSRVAQTLRHLLTLFELQEKFQEAIDTGKRAIAIEARTRGSDSMASANIMVRVGQLYFIMDGSASYEGKRYFEDAIRIKENKLGKDNKQVVELRAVFNDLVNPAAAAQKKYEEEAKAKEELLAAQEQEKRKKEEIQKKVSKVEQVLLQPGEIPPPPPPPPSTILGPPRPPPPPGAPRVAVVPATAYLSEIQQIASKKPALSHNEAKSRNAQAQSWWKQNYKYKK